MLRKFGQQVVQRISSLVARHELFERQGERPVQPPLAPGSWSTGETETGEAEAAEDSSDDEDAEEQQVQTADADALAGILSGGAMIVNHWATWCESCVAEKAAVRRLAERAEWPMIGISWDAFEDGDVVRSLTEVDTFVRAEQIEWPQYLVDGHPDDFFNAFDIVEQQIPQTWLVGPDGVILHRLHGIVDDAQIDDLLERMK